MTRYEDMDAGELRAERDYWYEQVAVYAREYRRARDSGDFGWEAGMAVALDTALAEVKRLNTFLKIGAAA